MTDPRPLADRLAEYVVPGATAAQIPAEYLNECLAEAQAMVTQAIGTAQGVPQVISDRATIEAASELFHRKQAPNGISQYAAPDGGALRIPRDPMNAARAILAPYLPLGIA
ncbi:hypothetical protein [Microbacterium sp. AR7-10]|uniref:hypothetical protein n=1 Tax=Microbacterium sp. AR7-10 TaxID=1891970 RepID=UPI0008FCC14C|nr:hypothetical protein [Microbacterium sp. AR7-10]OIU84614.1 hypothetical protein BFN01_02165 [Microbacterium sp. AR7-10]